ncbi:alpha/beta hydrolase [Marinobacter sp. JSM 1782161]|uniref:alpha/beta hydrolase n=1 Tax=Marinobacter sp. JSM 1782161 TaxID=2685906 RepID=UPI001401EE2D|nr:alpha/beta hydrolase [Marinobacter sp. JSM 1782161]
MTIHMKSIADAVPQPAPSRKSWRQVATHKALTIYDRLSPEAAGRLVHQRFFRPGRLPMPSRYEPLLDRAEAHTQLHQGANTLPVYSWGSGPVILGVHGWSGAGIQFGAYVEPLVAAGFRVVLFDAPAHGRAQGRQTDLYEMSAVVRHVADSVGGVYGVLAHSLGTLAAARAIADGLGTQRLVLLAPPLDLASVVDRLGVDLGIPEKILDVHRRLMAERFGRRVWDELSLSRLAPTLPVRGLVVVDSTDRAVAPGHSEQVGRLWETSQVLRTQGLGHHRILWHDTVVAPVLDFLGAHS